MELNFLIQHAKHSVQKAFANKSKISEEIINMEGMSGHKTRHLYNNMCNIPKGVYCEVGTWKGTSFIAAMHNNSQIKGICIDNWSQFGGPKDECIKRIHTYLPSNSFQIIDKNCWDIDQKDITEPIDIYLYDGEHSYEAQKKGITHFAKFLNKYSIIMVDDWSCDWWRVREGTYDGFEEAGLVIHYVEEIAPIMTNGDVLEGDTFWNGCGIFVCERIDII